MSTHECQCIKCKQSFNNAGALGAHYKRKHDNTTTRATGKNTGKFLLKCSCISCQIEITIQALDRHIKNCIIPRNKCLECSGETKTKFCSKSCAAKYNMKLRAASGYKISQEQKDKTSIKLTGKTKSEWDKICNHPPKPKKCTNCNKLHIRPGRTCSEECRVILMKRGASKGGKLSAQQRVKRSKDEIELFNLLSSTYNILSNHIIADGWDADIFIPSLNVAIFWNGPWHYKEMGIKGHSLLQVQNRDKIKTSLFKSLGIKIFVFEDRHFTPQSAYNSLLQALDSNQD